MAEQKTDPFEHVNRLASETNKDHLIQRLLVQIASMRKRNEKFIPLWSFVGCATAHGSGVSTAICKLYGVDSDTGEVVREILRDGSSLAETPASPAEPTPKP